MAEELTGRALDAMVAEKVFGRRVEWRGGKQVTKKPYYYTSLQGWFLVPEYSSTWEGLGLVVEEMERRGWELILCHGNANPGCKWHAEWGRGSFTPDAWADTAPEAVARAALKALAEE